MSDTQEQRARQAATEFTSKEFLDFLSWVNFPGGLASLHYVMGQFAAAYAAAETARMAEEIATLKARFAPECWFDGETSISSPEDYINERDPMSIGEEFELTAAIYWKERYRVTKVPDDNDDDYECQHIAGHAEAPTEYQKRVAEIATLKAKLATLERETIERCAKVAANYPISQTPRTGIAKAIRALIPEPEAEPVKPAK